jgi:hypothetical protein
LNTIIRQQPADLSIALAKAADRNIHARRGRPCSRMRTAMQDAAQRASNLGKSRALEGSDASAGVRMAVQI